MGNSVPLNYAAVFLTCDHQMMDAQGKASYIGIFRNIFLTSVPASIARFYVVAQIQNLQGTQLEIILDHPDGTRSQLGSATIEAENKEGDVLEVAIEVGNFPFREFGRYRFELMINGQ